MDIGRTAARALVLIVAARESFASTSDSILQVLAPGQVIVVATDAPAEWRYRFTVPANRYWQVQVHENGVDLEVKVESSGHEALIALNEPNYLWDWQKVSGVSPQAVADYVLVVTRPPGLAVSAQSRFQLEIYDDMPAGFTFALQETTLASDFEHANEQGRQESLVALGELADALIGDGQNDRALLVLLSLATRYNLSGQLDPAVSVFRRAVEMAEALSKPELKAMILERMAWPTRSTGNRDAAIDLLAQAGTLAKQVSDKMTMARAANGLCMLQMNEDLQQAGACFQDALVRAQASGDLALQVKIENNLGGVSSDLGEPMLAAEHFRRAIAAWEALGERNFQVSGLTNLANELRRMGRVDEAFRHYYQALTLAQEDDNHKRMGFILNQLGFAYLELGHVERAKVYLQRSLVSREKSGDVAGKAVTLNNLARAMALQGDLNDALALQNEVVEIRRVAGEQRRLGISLMRLAESQILAKIWPAAMLSLNEALQLADGATDRGTLARLRFLQSEVSLAHGRLADAARQGQLALQEYEQIQNRIGVLESSLQLARIDLAKGSLAAVTDRLESVFAEAERTRRRLVNPELRASFLATVRQAYELQIAVLWRRYGETDNALLVREAFNLSEMARSRTLLDVMAERDLNGQPQQSERRILVERLNAKSDRLVRLLSEGGGSEEVARLRVEAQRIEIGLDALDAASTGVEGEPEFAVLDQIQKQLPTDTSLAQYFVGDEHAWVWHVTSDRVVMRTIANREVLSEAVRQLLILARDPRSPDQEIRAVGKSLGAQLLAESQATRMFLAADGPLHQLPFALLVAPGSQSWLVEEIELLSVPSFSALSARKGREHVGDRRMLAIADPVYENSDRRLARETDLTMPSWSLLTDDLDILRSGLTRLHASQVEVDALKSIGGLNLEVLSGFEASTSQLLGRDLAEFAMLHFATHGVVSPEDPSATGVVLSLFDSNGRPQVGLLNTDLVRQLNLSADLVVLSGCQTAVGRRISGEGMFGLARAFYEAGAQSVIASLWQVSDRATAQLMAEFYRLHLREDMDAPRALAISARTLMQQRRFRHPFYWAAFTYNGASFQK